MRLLNKNTDYALRALIALDGPGDAFMPSSEIADTEGIPERFLKRILQNLIKEKFLESKEGAAGGVRLRRAAGAVNVIDIIRMFQGELQLSGCTFRKKPCPNRATCAIRRRLKAIEGKLLAEFEGLTIRDLAGKEQ